MGAQARIERWLTCARKTCCSFSYICVTGDDVTNIARTLSLEPWSFTIAIDAPHDADDGFILDATQRRYRLALRRAQAGAQSHETCTFLLALADGAARCGLGEGRPMTCRIFPAVSRENAIALEPIGCTCDWSGVRADADDDARGIARLATERARYATVIARWNAYVRATEPETPYTLRDLGRYLLDAYAA